MTADDKLEPIGYEKALEMAWDEVARIDPIAISETAEVPSVDEDLAVPFLGNEYLVDLEGRRMTSKGQEVAPFIAVLVLHYLGGCGPGRPSGNYISFREIPGGQMYYPAFRRRAIERVAQAFGGQPRVLLEAGAILDGKELRMGDASIEIRAFPKISVAVVVWQGDEELPASANILFDSIAPEILPMEDLSVVGNLVASILAKQVEKREIPPLEKPEVQGRG